MDVLPPTATYLAFLAAAGAVILLPGPDTVTVLSHGATRGTRAGVSSAVGVATGVLVHTTVVALGLAAVLERAPAAFAALKLLGAGYLVYLGVHTLRSDLDTPDTGPSSNDAAASRPFTAGFLVNATNPKVAIFFLAFLPAFAKQGPDAGIQLVALGATYSVLTTLYLGGVGAAAGRMQRVFESPRAQRGIRTLSGVAILALAGLIAAGVNP